MAPLCGSRKSGRVGKMVLCLLLFVIPITSSADKSHQTLEVQEQLKRLNKPALQSIKSPDGDIIDCIHIQDQPAFDHPLLKNHTIKTAPSFLPGGRSFHENKATSKAKPIPQLWHSNGRCPEGTIPIKRTKEDDILRASSVESYGRKEHLSILQPSSVEPNLIDNNRLHVNRAIAYVDSEDLLGTKVYINVWNPQVEQPNEYSSSQIWIERGYSSIQAGWQVNPRLYGDNKSRLFIYWTSDRSQNSGCYDLLCSGFVQTNHEIALGASITPLSTYGGPQYEINIRIWQDPAHRVWWMQFGNHVMGYWPASLFIKLVDSANTVAWGGEAVNLRRGGRHTTTQMGSGHFPREGFGKASFFRNILVEHSSRELVDPGTMETYQAEANCYGVETGKSKDFGTYIYYGGPGGSRGCP